MQFIRSAIHYNTILLHNYILLAAVGIFIVSIFLCSVEKYKWSLAALVLGSLLLNIFAIHLDPFLNSWDERFHALVAKNLSAHPFQPMLYANPVLPFDYKNWT